MTTTAAAVMVMILNECSHALCLGLAKLMVSAKDAEAIVANTSKLPPQRTPPELDRLQAATKAVWALSNSMQITKLRAA
eukprot:scaffold257120_cov37-Prasinocladus_malaysianus.AAC.1